MAQFITYFISDSPEVTTIKFTVGGDVAFVLSCYSQNSPPTHVIWKKDGKQLSLSNSTDYKMSQNLLDRVNSSYLSTLSMDGVLDDVVGEYSCTVTNTLGTSNTRNVTVERKLDYGRANQ